MRQRLKLIVFAALSAALTVTGLSIAAGSGDSGSSTSKQRDLRPPRIMSFDRDVADVMKQIHEAVAKKAPDLADPVIQKAEDSGDITGDQADELRAAAQAIADGERPNLDRSLLRDADVRKVIRDAFAAARDQAPEIGEPIVQRALDDKKITSAQAGRLRDMLKNAPLPPFPFLGGPGPRPGFGGCGPGGRALDKDVAAVLDDIHQAFDAKQPKSVKEAAAIADPIIDKAVAAKKITSAQASKLREGVKNVPAPFGAGLRRHFRGGSPPLGGPGGPGGPGVLGAPASLEAG